jgi:hypothetical protein
MTEFRCCDQGFADEPALQEHLATKVHTPPLRCDRVCKECNKEFVNETALLQHQASVVHGPFLLWKVNGAIQDGDGQYLSCLFGGIAGTIHHGRPRLPSLFFGFTAT